MWIVLFNSTPYLNYTVEYISDLNVMILGTLCFTVKYGAEGFHRILVKHLLLLWWLYPAPVQLSQEAFIAFGLHLASLGKPLLVNRSRFMQPSKYDPANTNQKLQVGFSSTMTYNNYCLTCINCSSVNRRNGWQTQA